MSNQLLERKQTVGNQQLMLEEVAGQSTPTDKRCEDQGGKKDFEHMIRYRLVLGLLGICPGHQDWQSSIDGLFSTLIIFSRETLI